MALHPGLPFPILMNTLQGLGPIPMSKRMLDSSETGASSLPQSLGSIPKNWGLARSL